MIDVEGVAQPSHCCNQHRISSSLPESLKAKVAEGKLGRKSGEGFYNVTLISYYKWEGDKLAP